MISIKFTHDKGGRLNTSNLFVDAQGRVNELTDNGFLVARNDISFHMVSDINKPSQAVNHSGRNSYTW